MAIGVEGADRFLPSFPTRYSHASDHRAVFRPRERPSDEDGRTTERSKKEKKPVFSFVGFRTARRWYRRWSEREIEKEKEMARPRKREKKRNDRTGGGMHRSPARQDRSFFFLFPFLSVSLFLFFFFLSLGRFARREVRCRESKNHSGLFSFSFFSSPSFLSIFRTRRGEIARAL